MYDWKHQPEIFGTNTRPLREVAWLITEGKLSFLVNTRQSDFAELHSFRKQLEMQQILDSFEKRIEKE
mgnify:CR=1 FL=1